jgi:phenylpropionate dioxygenase-like ring-hydroxylating dioxygenase large terminal subunit
MWPVHYTRAVENQLDVVHLPFVHASSIGRGNKTLVNGPVVKWKENLMTFYVDNKLDDGKTKPLKPNEIENYKSLFSLQFQMPNLWQNVISADLRIVAIFVPIDDEHTRIYLRFYQKFMKIPVLKQIVNKMSNISNKYILHQDRRVVLTQMPKKTEVKMAENLIQGDAPIIEYRKRRAFLKGEL